MRRTLLIVDDIQINREILKKILGNEYQILEAENGQTAVDIMKRSYLTISAVLLDLSMPVMNGFDVLSCMRRNPDLKPIPVVVMTGQTGEDAEVKALKLGANDFISKPYNATVVRQRIFNVINLRETSATVNELQKDRLTGLYGRSAFFEFSDRMISEKPAGYYAMICIDVDNFKAINDQYGTKKGDDVLCFVADSLKKSFEETDSVCGRIMADNFSALIPLDFMPSQKFAQIRQMSAKLDGSILPIALSIGWYKVDDTSLSASAMYDRAMLAEESVKGRYDCNIAQFDESMRQSLLTEQEVVSEMKQALELGQFEPWFQPQYNHATGKLIGAEVLVRWRHPKKGMIPPSQFIPLFEKNGFIYDLDKYIWKETCRCLQKWIKEGRNPLPVSINISRYDIFRDDLIDVISGLITQYNVPADLLRLEITESAFSISIKQIVSVVKKLVEKGFTIEIDDFGSGYSSLNTLKDVPAQIIKLDMKFMENSDDNQRGGNIVESMVRMAKWLDMAIIAEGVETRNQADFLKSIGCFYVQGYLYARPMPLADFEALTESSGKQQDIATLETVDNLDSNAFWNPDSMDTLIFNNYLGGACIYEYYNDRIELLRANDKYIQVLGSVGMTIEDALKLNWSEYLCDCSREQLNEALKKSAEEKTEACAELIFVGLPGCTAKTYLHSTLRVIAKAGDRLLIYCYNENITAQRLSEQKREETSQQLQAIMANINGGISARVFQNEDSHIVFANDNYYAMLGYTREQFQKECPHGLFDRIIKEDRQRVTAMIEHVLSSGDPENMDYRVNRRDGSVIWVRGHGSVCSFSGFKDSVFLEILVDITDQMETTQQMLFLESMAHDLLALTDSEAAVREILNRIRQFFAAERTAVFEYDGSMLNRTYVSDGCHDSKDEGISEIPEKLCSYWLSEFDQKDVAIVTDIGQIRTDHLAALLQRNSIHSLAAIPLQRNGKFIGCLSISNPQQKLKQIKHLSSLGDYVSAMLNRRDLNAAVQDENNEKLAVMNGIPGGFVRMKVKPDGSSAALYHSEGFQKLVGMNSEDLMAIYGENSMNGVHPEDLPNVKNTLKMILEQGEVQNASFRLRKGGGGYVPVTIFGKKHVNSSGEAYIDVYYTKASPQQERQDIQIELLDNLPCGAAMYELEDGKLKVIHLNRHYWEMVDRVPQNYDDISVLSAIHPDDQKLITNMAANAVRDRCNAICRVRILCGNGSYRTFRVEGRILTQNDGKYIIYASYTHDGDA